MRHRVLLMPALTIISISIFLVGIVPANAARLNGDLNTPPPIALPTSTTTPWSLPISIADFTVASDSVVATARIRPSTTSQRVTVRWGDGTESNAFPFRPWASQTGPEFVFQHVYTPPQDGKPFVQFVTGSVEDLNGSVDVEILRVDVVPRYAVIQYGAFFRPLEHCESIFESYSEWEITQSINNEKRATWRQDRLTNGGIIVYDFQRLEGSAIYREMTMNDTGINVGYSVKEIDPWIDEFVGNGWINLHPSMESRKMTLNLNQDCSAEIMADVESRLLKPGLIHDGPVVVAS